MEDKKRLLDIVKILDKNKKVIDVGTDHGLVPLYLAKNNISKDIIATDISKPSLQKLIDRLDDNTSKIIKTIHTDGFKGLKSEPNQVAIIAGMGANTIIDIINDSLDFVRNLDYLIIESNINTSLLREYLMENDFDIELDFLTYEKRKFYDILKVKDKKTRYLSFEEYYYGFTDIENKSKLLLEKLKIDRDKNNNFLNHIKENSDDKKAIKKIEDRLEAIRKVEERCK